MKAQQQGFALVAAIILVVILAALSAFVASMVSGQSANQQLERMSRVTDLAAQAGLEWGAYQVLRVPLPPLPGQPCFLNTTLPPGTFPGSLGTVSVLVRCGTGSPVMIYRITATATYGGVPASPDFVQRQKTAIFTR